MPGAGKWKRVDGASRVLLPQGRISWPLLHSPFEPARGVGGKDIYCASARELEAQEASFAPALFQNGNGYVTATHADETPLGNTDATTPAQPGETISIAGMGFGPTDPAQPTGQVMGAPAGLANPVQVTIWSEPQK